MAGSADGCFSPKTCVARVDCTQHALFRFPKVQKFPGSRQKETERGSKKNAEAMVAAKLSLVEADLERVIGASQAVRASLRNSQRR